MKQWFYAVIKFILAQQLRHQLAIIILALSIIAATNYLVQQSIRNSSPIPQKLAPKAPERVTIPNGSATKDAAILSLFQPSPLELKGRSLEDTLREQFRNLYTGIFLLKECQVNISLYHEKLSRDFNTRWSQLPLTDQTAVTRYRTLQSIIEEARSSYVLLYQDTPCKNRNLRAFKRYFSQLP